MVLTMDPIAKNAYVVIYIHSSNNNRPRFGWVRKVLAIFNRNVRLAINCRFANSLIAVQEEREAVLYTISKPLGEEHDHSA